MVNRSYNVALATLYLRFGALMDKPYSVCQRLSHFQSIAATAGCAPESRQACTYSSMNCQALARNRAIGNRPIAL